MSPTNRPARERSDIAYMDNREWVILNGDESWEVAETSGGGVVIVGPSRVIPTDDPLNPIYERTQINIAAADALQLAKALVKIANKPLGITAPRRKATK